MQIKIFSSESLWKPLDLSKHVKCGEIKVQRVKLKEGGGGTQAQQFKRTALEVCEHTKTLCSFKYIFSLKWKLMADYRSQFYVCN